MSKKLCLLDPARALFFLLRDYCYLIDGLLYSLNKHFMKSHA